MSSVDSLSYLKKVTELAKWKRLESPVNSPGTLVADTALPAPFISLLSYNKGEVIEKDNISLKDAFAEVGPKRVTWIDIQGLGNVEVLKELGDIMNLHRLELEDVLDFSQRIRIQTHEEYCFLIGKHLLYKSELLVQQVSLFFDSKTVVTLTPVDSSFLNPVRFRIQNGIGQIRRQSSEYLIYAIVDTLIDSSFPAIDQIGDLVDNMELEVFGHTMPEEDVASTIRDTRLSLSYCRKWILPMKDVLKNILEGQNEFVGKDTRVYFSDCMDHVLTQLETLNALRDETADLMNLHLSVLSQKMNEIMKVLTIISTIFIPLGFIAGCYGMNFNPAASELNMPELNWPYGYPTAIGLMIFVATLLIGYFFRKKWIRFRF